MVLNIVKKNLMGFWEKWLFIVFIVYAVYLIPILQSCRIEGLSLWEFVLLAVTDQHYILYVMCLSFIYFVLKNISRDEQEVLVRSRSYLRYFSSQAVSLAAISSVFVLLHLMIAMIMGFGLSFNNVFTIGGRDTVLSFFAKHFDDPLSGILASLPYLILGLSILGMFIAFLNHFLKTRLVVISVILLLVVTMLNYQVFFNDSPVPFLFLDNYIILSHAIYALGANFYLLPICEMVFAAMMLFLIRKYWHKQIGVNRDRGGKMSVVRYYLKMLFTKKNVLIMVITSLIITFSVLVLYEDLSFHDILLWQFWGQGEGDFFLPWFLTMLIYNGAPIYLLCHFLSKDSSERSVHLTIRLRSVKRWMNGVFGSGVLFIVVYILLSVGISAIVALVSGMDFAGYHGIGDMFAALGLQPVSPLLYLAIVGGKSIELIFYFLIIFLIYCFTKKITVGFLILQLSYIVYFIPAVIFTYLPVGIGSLSRIREFSGTGLYFWQAAVFLLAANSILYGYIRLFGCRKIFD